MLYCPTLYDGERKVGAMGRRLRPRRLNPSARKVADRNVRHTQKGKITEQDRRWAIRIYLLDGSPRGNLPVLRKGRIEVPIPPRVETPVLQQIEHWRKVWK